MKKMVKIVLLAGVATATGIAVKAAYKAIREELPDFNDEYLENDEFETEYTKSATNFNIEEYRRKPSDIVLKQMLRDHTEQEIADIYCVSLPTVRRWKKSVL